MITVKEIIIRYQQIKEETQLKLSDIKKKIYRISSIRILLFLAGIAGVIYFYSSGWVAVCTVTAVTFIPFLALVKYHNRLFYKKDYLEKKIEINDNELSAINYDYSCFDSGMEYVSPAHLYSFDIDLFGKNSLYQYINRTSTQFGQKILAGWLIRHLTRKEEIESRQEAVRELAAELEFRQRFRILGLLYKGQVADGQEIETWTQSRNIYLGKPIFQIIRLVVPTINAILWILAILGFISFNWPGLAFVSFVIFSFAFQKNISQIQTIYGKKLKILTTYAELIKMIQERKMNSALLKEIQKKLGKGEQSAYAALERLSAELNILDQRNNVLLSTILDGLLFWQLRQVMRIEAWKKQYASELLAWLQTVGEIDALNSLATFAYNHPNYSFPTITDQPYTLKAKDMGHPLMNRNKCVKNDLDITKRPIFIIITGANMAGKSTYLRTIGVNYLLACIGAPVCCKNMDIYPAQLITSLRTSDSLTDNESYFFAELKRLKLIIDKLNSNEELFIILDEILKGTNSTDKQKGSFALIKQFIHLQTNGIIATHDLQLGKLVELFPENIRNYCFEADITNNELTFSYHLKEGVAQNMNACFLMKKMGIIVSNS